MKQDSIAKLKLFQLTSKIKQTTLLEKTLQRFQHKATQLQLHIKEQEKLLGISDPKHYNYPPSARDAALRQEKLLVSIQELTTQKDALTTEIESLRMEIEKMQQKLFEKAIPSAYKTA